MLKPAVFVAIVLGCAPLVQASTAGPTQDLAQHAAEAGCHATTPAEAVCPLRAADPAEGVTLAAPDQPAMLTTDLDDAPAGTGIDLKDASAASSHAPARDGRKPLVPALLALLAMVILLPRRPTQS